MHFNYRTDAATLTLPRRLGVVKFPNYRYWGQGSGGALNPKDGLHFELLVTLDMEAIPVRSSLNDKKMHLHRELPLTQLDRWKLG